MVTDDLPIGPKVRKCEVCAADMQFARHLTAEDRAWDEAHDHAAPIDERPYDGRHVRMSALSPEEVQERGGPSGDTH